MRNGSNVKHGTLTYAPVNLGGGGFVTRLKIADDGTLVAGTDSYSGYFRAAAASKWTPMLRPGDNISASLLPTDLWNGGPGAYDVAICATNSSIQCLYVMGWLYRTTDGWVTATRTNFTRNTNMVGNGSYRLTGAMVEIDPQNGSVIYVGTDAGVTVSLDGGATWTPISTATIPLCTGGRYYSIAFDRSSTVTAGKTQGIYIFSNGVGLKKTSNAGTSWAAVTGGITPPTLCGCLAVHPTTGVVFVGGDGAGGNAQLYKYASAAWAAPATATSVKHVVLDSTKVYAFTDSGTYRASADSGATFNATATAPVRSFTDIPWHVWGKEDWMSNGGVVKDPTQNRLWIGEGIGAWSVDAPPTTDGGTFSAVERSKGIENLVVAHLHVNANGTLFASCHDRPFFAAPRTAATSRYPSRHGPNNTNAIYMGTMMDSAIDDPNFVVGIGQDNAYYSTDGTAPSIPFASNPFTAAGGGFTGNIAVGNKSNIIMVPGQNGGPPVYTLDGGRTWNDTGLGSTGWINSYTLMRRIILADKANPGIFYLFNVGNAATDTSGKVGVWKTTNGGASWTRVRSAVITTYGADFWNGNLKQVPGQAGHFLWSAGDNGDGLYKSTDFCVTWTKISGSGETFAFGMGAALPGGSGYPAILANGYRGATYGWWLSEDGGTTWTQIYTHLGNVNFDQVDDIAGDANVYGLWYAGMGGSGASRLIYFDTAHAT